MRQIPLASRAKGQQEEFVGEQTLFCLFCRIDISSFRWYNIHNTLLTYYVNKHIEFCYGKEGVLNMRCLFLNLLRSNFRCGRMLNSRADDMAGRTAAPLMSSPSR